MDNQITAIGQCAVNLCAGFRSPKSNEHRQPRTTARPAGLVRGGALQVGRTLLPVRSRGRADGDPDDVRTVYRVGGMGACRNGGTKRRTCTSTSGKKPPPVFFEKNALKGGATFSFVRRTSPTRPNDGVDAWKRLAKLIGATV